MFDLTVCQLRKGARVESLVVIGHIDRQEAADVREVSSTADRTARDLDVQPPVTPAADGIHEIEFRRVPFLAQQMYLVAEIDQRPGQLRIVDITSCAPQEVAMEYQNAHSHHVPRTNVPPAGLQWIAARAGGRRPEKIRNSLCESANHIPGAR